MSVGVASRIPNAATQPMPNMTAAMTIGTHKPALSAIKPPMMAVHANASDPVVRKNPSIRPRDVASSIKSPANARLPALNPAVAIPNINCATITNQTILVKAITNMALAANPNASMIIGRRCPMRSERNPHKYGAANDPNCWAANIIPTSAGPAPRVAK